MADRKWVLGLSALCCLYFALLLRFYLVRYDVPDYFLYHRFGVQGLAAKDGFSSLFVWLSTYNTRFPLAYHVVPLACLSAALFSLNYAFQRSVRGSVARKLFLGVSFSSGIWYYFAGKVYYEFPFVALCVALSLLAIARMRTMTPRSAAQRRVRGLALLLLGFALSFKPHGIFVVLGLLMLLAVSREGRAFYRTQNAVAEWLRSGACFLGGFLLGNYNLLLRFDDMIAGLHAYPAQCDLGDHLFGDARLVWDHVNLPPFDTGAFNVIALGVILFVLPLLLENRLYVVVNGLLAAAYGVFIQLVSPGYVWHGFPFCLFALLSLAFMLAESEALPRERRSTFRALLGVALAIQLYTNFFDYVPQQISAFLGAQDAASALERNSGAINRKLLQLADQLDGTFTVKVTFRFARAVTDDLEAREQNPLEVGDPRGWRAIVAHPRYVDAGGATAEAQNEPSPEHAYLIFVEPDALLRVPSYMAERRDEGSFAFDGCRVGYYRVE